VHVQKNVLVLVRMLPEVLRSCPGAVLVVAGEVAGDLWYNRGYIALLEGVARALGVQDHVRFVRRFIPLEEMEEFYAASDVVLLPHYQGYGSASGVARQALAASRPMICSDIAKFEDIALGVSHEISVPPNRPDQWAKVVIRLLKDRAFRDRIVEAQTRCAEAWSWPEVAGMHSEIYRSLA